MDLPVHIILEHLYLQARVAAFIRKPSPDDVVDARERKLRRSLLDGRERRERIIS